ncbi:MAG: pyrimidine dimer DNA glycosylase/endonuclease V [Patescibacteria group bacterium]
MRIWDIEPKKLCRQHLLGEHRELHAIWSILNNNKKGYRNHPETKRWVGKKKALFLRHQKLVEEMQKRNYQHHSPLNKKGATGKATQNTLINTKKEQQIILKNKNCLCLL